MRGASRRFWICALGVAMLAFALPLVANATVGRSHHRHNATLARFTRAKASGGSGEAALTGTTLSSASSAALVAVPGGTVDTATTETDGTGSYEVIVTKSDGSRVKVIEDSSFTVLSATATHCG